MRAGRVGWQFGRAWPPASLSSVVSAIRYDTNAKDRGQPIIGACDAWWRLCDVDAAERLHDDDGVYTTRKHVVGAPSAGDCYSTGPSRSSVASEDTTRQNLALVRSCLRRGGWPCFLAFNDMVGPTIQQMSANPSRQLTPGDRGLSCWTPLARRSCAHR